MRTSRTTLIALASLLIPFFFAVPARADHFSDNFSAHLDHRSLDALARDVAALAGASSFHHGRALGFPLGVDVGVHESFVGVGGDDAILRDNGSTEKVLSMQAEYGLPGHLNLVGRTGNLGDGNIVGGGVRVPLWNSDNPLIPDVSLTGLFDRVGHQDFRADVYTADVVASFDVPFIHPYVGIGYDAARLDVKGRVMASPGLDDVRSGRGSETRLEAGINISLVPFTYLSLGGGLTNGRKLGHVALGLRF